MMEVQLGSGEKVMCCDYYGLTPAMITALFQKPNDRQFIIALENSIISFIDSNADSCELAPMNSYFRLLSHQIAEYHNLKHALARSHDNCVIVFKGHGFMKVDNKPLLQELSPPLNLEAPHFQHLERGEPTSEEELKNKNTKKYKILRRSEIKNSTETTPVSSDQESDQGEDSSHTTKSDATLEEKRIEREKRYEQRKQEIFDTPKKESHEDAIGKDSENNSPQPYQFETSRYKLHQLDNQPPPQSRSNRRRKGFNHYNNNDYHGNFQNQYHSAKHRYSYQDAVKYSNNNGMATYGMMQPYMLYPPQMGTPPVSGQIPMMYPSPMPMFAPGTDVSMNAASSYMGYPNANQIPFHYNQSPHFPSVPMYYGMYMPNLRSSDSQNGNHGQYYKSSSSAAKDNSKSNLSLASSKSSDTFKRSNSSLLEKEGRKEKDDDADVQEISTELKELSVQ